MTFTPLFTVLELIVVTSLINVTRLAFLYIVDEKTEASTFGYWFNVVTMVITGLIAVAGVLFFIAILFVTT